MKSLSIRTQTRFPQRINRIHGLGKHAGLFIAHDKCIFEFTSNGEIKPLGERPEFASEQAQLALRPRGQPWHSRGLTLTEDRSTLFVAHCGWSAEGSFLDVCLLDLAGRKPVTSRRVTGLSEDRSDHDPFYFLDGKRIGVAFWEECFTFDARDLSPLPMFKFITKEFSPPVGSDCVHPHLGGNELSLGMGEPGWGVYRRVVLTETGNEITVEIVDEAVFKGRADLWATVPSPSGTYAFVLLMNHETGMVLPGGPDAHPVQELGEVVRIGCGRTERLPIRGDLAIDFGVAEARWFPPEDVPTDSYRVYPKGPNSEGPIAVLCPVSDDAVLYPTPGGTLIEVNFARQETREFARLGFPVQAMCLLSPTGPLAVAGGAGEFLILDFEP